MTTSATKPFARYTDMLRQRHQTFNLYSNVKKMGYLKNIWMPQCSGNDLEVGIKDFLKGGDCCEIYRILFLYT